MSVKFLFQLEADTIAEKAVRIPFDFPDKSSVPEGHKLDDVIVISPISTRTWFKLKPLILSIEKVDFELLVEMEDRIVPDLDLIEVMSKYDKLILDIICIGIHNKKSDPPEWFRDVLIDNSAWKDLYILLNAILYRVGYNPFYKSITILRSVSPLTEPELIAAQKNLKSWTSL